MATPSLPGPEVCPAAPHGEALTVCSTKTPVHAPRDLLDVYVALSAMHGTEGVALLESASGREVDRRWSMVAFHPVAGLDVAQDVITLRGNGPARAWLSERLHDLRRTGLLRDDRPGFELSSPSALWDVLDELRGAFRVEGVVDGPAAFGFFAMIGYDACRYTEPVARRLPEDDDAPEVSLTLFSSVVVRDERTGAVSLVRHDSSLWVAPWPEEVARSLETRRVRPHRRSRAGDAHDETCEADYAAHVERCLEHIRAGDIYQVQLGHEVTAGGGDSPVEVYERLRRRNPSPYMFLAVHGGRSLIGASPELFVRVEDGTVMMRPIAGTAPRPDDPRKAELVKRRLAGDPKEIAEHVMLVDLCRNDIAPVCVPGTLDVPALMNVEEYSHVFHLVSTVTGRLAPGAHPWSVIPTSFPAGTMTGAPKRRAMEIIEEHEISRRGMYAGAIGMLGIGADETHLALCIRTVTGRADVYTTRASAGVVAASDAGREWEETCAKFAAGLWAMTGKESVA